MGLTSRQDHNRLMNNTDKIVHATESYEMADTDRVVVCGAAAMTITLPPPGVAAGEIIVIKSPVTRTGTATIAEKTNGVGDIAIGSVVLSGTVKAVNFFSDGSCWHQVK